MKRLNPKAWQTAQRLEIAWWQSYLSRQNPASYRAWKLVYWQNILKEIECFLPQNAKRVLDAGCGPSGIFISLQDKEVTAVDPLIKHYNQSSLLNFNNYPYVRFEACPFENFDTREPFPIVFAMNAINHFRDIEASIRKLIQCTAAGGLLVISVDAHRYSLFKYLLRWIKIDRMHPWQYNAPEYKTMFQQKGVELKYESMLKKGLVFNHRLMVFAKNRK